MSLVTVPGELPGADRLVERLRAALPQLVGFVHSINGGQAEISSGLEGTTLWGRPYLLEKVAGVTLKISVNAFFQTNTRQTEVLYGLATSRKSRRYGSGAARDDGARRGPDARSEPMTGPSSGTFTLASAPSGCRSPGRQGAPGHRGDSRGGGGRAGERPVERHRERLLLEGDVAKVLRQVAEGALELPPRSPGPDVIVVDPPRAGLTDKAIARIGELGAPRIVYISCNPATMGPNVAKLQEYGYRLVRVTPVDMFPHTRTWNAWGR